MLAKPFPIQRGRLQVGLNVESRDLPSLKLSAVHPRLASKVNKNMVPIMRINLFSPFVCLLVLTSTCLCTMGCRSEQQVGADGATLTRTSLKANERDANPIPDSLVVNAPDEVSKIFKRKCFICHGGQKTEGNFDFKRMVSRTDEQSDWRPIDLDGATRIKFAILPIDGKAPKMPRRSGSILNSLTREEANTIAKWTDYPF